jgi:hypothetical protein
LKNCQELQKILFPAFHSCIQRGIGKAKFGNFMVCNCQAQRPLSNDPEIVKLAPRTVELRGHFSPTIKFGSFALNFAAEFWALRLMVRY